MNANAAVASRAWPNLLVAFMCLLLVFAPVNNKVAGLAYVVLLVAAAWAYWRVPALQAPGGNALRKSARFWLGVCALAALVRYAIAFAWGDSLGDRHFEMRLLLAALAVYVLLNRLFLSATQKTWLIYALALALCVAFGIAFVYSRVTPTNPIPWAAAMSFLTCVLMAAALENGTDKWARLSATLGATAGVGAVILSQSRGSYGIVAWAGVLGAWALYRWLRTTSPSGGFWHRPSTKVCLPSAVVLGLVVLMWNVPRFYTDPAARIQEAWNDVKVLSTASAMGQPRAAAISTSVGVRLYMWQVAMVEIRKAPVLGHSRAKRIEWVQGLGKVSGAEAFGGLAHLHSDPLNAWFEHGLPGLLSYLGLAFGLAWVAWRHALPGSALRYGLAGLVFMHLSSGLTNMNTGHNYYGVVLSLSIALTWLLSGSWLRPSRPSQANG